MEDDLKPIWEFLSNSVPVDWNNCSQKQVLDFQHKACKFVTELKSQIDRRTGLNKILINQIEMSQKRYYDLGGE